MHNLQTNRVTPSPPRLDPSSPLPVLLLDNNRCLVCVVSAPAWLSAALVAAALEIGSCSKRWWEDGGRVSDTPPLTPVSPGVGAVYVTVCILSCLCICIQQSIIMYMHTYTMCIHMYSVCICYYTFWSGVAGLSARLPEGG